MKLYHNVCPKAYLWMKAVILRSYVLFKSYGPCVKAPGRGIHNILWQTLVFTTATLLNLNDVKQLITANTALLSLSNLLKQLKF